MNLPPAARPIVRTYLVLSAMFNASLALIWGVNTLFLMSAGLSIFQVMLVNATFSLGQFVFEVPTGVVADTIGRRASLLLCLATVLVGTLAYLAAACSARSTSTCPTSSARRSSSRRSWWPRRRCTRSALPRVRCACASCPRR